MPYPSDHAAKTKAKITEAARALFNRHGFENVSIDMVMERAGLTRGGFYRHFSSKEALYGAAVESFLMGRGAQWRDEAGIDLSNLSPDMAQQMIDSYLSDKHLTDIEDQCPMIALPSDVARQAPEVQQAYQRLLEAMVWLFETSQSDQTQNARDSALTMTALCVGGMILARSVPDAELAKEVQAAARTAASKMIGSADIGYAG